MHTLYRFRYSHTVINRFKFPAQQSDRLGYENTAIAARRATRAAALDQCLRAACNVWKETSHPLQVMANLKTRGSPMYPSAVLDDVASRFDILHNDMLSFKHYARRERGGKAFNHTERSVFRKCSQKWVRIRS